MLFAFPKITTMEAAAGDSSLALASVLHRFVQSWEVPTIFCEALPVPGAKIRNQLLPIISSEFIAQAPQAPLQNS